MCVSCKKLVILQDNYNMYIITMKRLGMLECKLKAKEQKQKQCIALSARKLTSFRSERGEL